MKRFHEKVLEVPRREHRGFSAAKDSGTSRRNYEFDILMQLRAQNRSCLPSSHFVAEINDAPRAGPPLLLVQLELATEVRVAFFIGATVGIGQEITEFRANLRGTYRSRVIMARVSGQP